MEVKRQRLHPVKDTFPYKVELHVHLDGAIRLSTLFDIARRRNIDLHSENEDDFRRLHCVYTAKSLSRMLATFDIFMPVLAGDREAISRLAYEFCEDCANNNIRYVEARYSPHLLANSEEKPEYATEQGDTTPQEVVRLVTDAFRRGSKDFNIRAYSILCCMRHRPDWSDEVVELARQFQQAGVVGVDIAGGSVQHGVDIAGGSGHRGNDVEFFHDTHKQAFKRAKEYGLHITVHAGEAGPAAKVQEAIDELFAERIGHGYHCVDDDVIYKAVLNKRLHLEACPISSMCTGAVPEFGNHPITRFARDGVNFSMNSDDPLVFDSCLLDDYHSALEMGLTREQIIKTIFNAARASFTSEAEKQTILNELVDVYGDEKTYLQD